MANIVDSNATHVRYIAMMMRDGDKEELKASGSDPLEALSRGLQVSTMCKTVMIDGIPCLMFGVAPISALSGKGSPWLLGTDQIRQIRKWFISGCAPVVDEMLSYYPVLQNRVDARNKASIRWLKWLGFEIMPSEPTGINGELFHPFEMRRVMDKVIDNV